MSAGGLPALLVASATRHPTRDAIVLEGTTLSYQTLADASERFARSLRAGGVRDGDRVGLWLPKSPEAIVALWGVLRAGAAYVPIDPGAPPARLGAIARDAGIAALVTRADRAPGLGEAFADDAPMHAIWLADAATPPTLAGPLARLPIVGWREAMAESGAALPTVADDALAYILYTSGSTGEPKGVAHTHASARAFVDWAAVTFALAPEDRVANHAPFHFDLSTFDLFAGAAAGAAVHPVPARVTAFPAAIAKLYAESRLTVWYETPSSLALMLHRGGLGGLDASALRLLLFAGEVMPPKLLRELMALAPHARFANLYGPTETNVCTWQRVEAAPTDDAPLPIGHACSGDTTHVLDEALHPVAAGATGELWVSGPSVMRGYWGRPERTAESLRTITPTDGAAVLAYRTGDLVRARTDGALEFFGRRDHQLKTRGYRVELGEIETALHGHSGVAEAVAWGIADAEIGHRLEAAVVRVAGSDVGEAITEAALKQHCAALLPRYMVPETIHFRDALPRTSSGKIDRRALGGAS